MRVFFQDAATILSTGGIQDTAVTASAPAISAADSVVVDSPLPGGIAEVVRFLLNSVPSWVQLGGVVIGAVVALILSRYLFLNKKAIGNWIATRQRGVKIALALGVVAVVAAGGVMGSATWDYTQHDNDFCTGCHVMNPAFQRYVAEAGKHDTLSCHSCHTQSMFASTRQLYLWIAERPEEIKEHAKVENRVCESCHTTADTAKWQRIVSTAGHRVHLESDSSTLKGLQCVTCHGVEIHRFKTVDETCGQSECHAAAETKIVLGKMEGQTTLHCAGCHGFTDDVVALATRDSAAGVLRPGSPQCLGCHEMKKALPGYEARLDPHGGKCGTCHNPHKDSVPAAAKNSCAASGCHSDWRDEPFHVGASHRKRAEDCLTCHVAHTAKVDASDCQGCHQAVRDRGKIAPPVRFDTTAALRLRIAPPASATPR